MKTKLSHQLNEVFKYLVLFLLSFVWINYYYHNFIASIILSVITASIVSYALSFFFHKKQYKIKLTKEQSKTMKEFSLQFVYSTQKENVDFFSKIFKSDTSYISHTSQYNILLKDTTKIMHVPIFSYENINENIIVNIYKLAKAEKVNKCIISGISFSNEAELLAYSFSDIDFEVYSNEKTYEEYIKPNNLEPKKLVSFKPEKRINFSLFLTLLINKKNTKHYFYSAIIMLIASFFIRFSNYYVIFSSIMFILTLLSFYSDRLTFLKKQTSKKNN